MYNISGLEEGISNIQLFKDTFCVTLYFPGFGDWFFFFFKSNKTGEEKS